MCCQSVCWKLFLSIVYFVLTGTDAKPVQYTFGRDIICTLTLNLYISKLKKRLANRKAKQQLSVRRTQVISTDWSGRNKNPNLAGKTNSWLAEEAYHFSL